MCTKLNKLKQHCKEERAKTPQYCERLIKTYRKLLLLKVAQQLCNPVKTFLPTITLNLELLFFKF